MTRRRGLPRDLAVALVNTIARLGEKAVMAWPNRTHLPLCETCKQANCKKKTTKEIR